jgi:hypothetical protein
MPTPPRQSAQPSSAKWRRADERARAYATITAFPILTRKPIKEFSKKFSKLSNNHLTNKARCGIIIV